MMMLQQVGVAEQDVEFSILPSRCIGIGAPIVDRSSYGCVRHYVWFHDFSPQLGRPRLAQAVGYKNKSLTIRKTHLTKPATHSLTYKN